MPSGKMERPIPGRRFVSPSGGQKESFADLRARLEADLILASNALTPPETEQRNPPSQKP